MFSAAAVVVDFTLAFWLLRRFFSHHRQAIKQEIETTTPAAALSLSLSLSYLQASPSRLSVFFRVQHVSLSAAAASTADQQGNGHWPLLSMINNNSGQTRSAEGIADCL